MNVKMFAGVIYSCNEMEQWLTVQWCIAWIGWMLTAVPLAFLPKLVKDYPPSANKAVMLTVSGVFMLTMIGQTVTMLKPVELSETASADMTTGLIMSAVFGGLLVIAAVVHKEPETGKGLLL